MRNKNLRRFSAVVNSQTLYHLNHWAAMNGWGPKDLGRVIDKIVRERLVSHGKVTTDTKGDVRENEL